MFELSRPAPRPSTKPLLNVSHGSFNQPHGPDGLSSGMVYDDVRARIALDESSASSSSRCRFLPIAKDPVASAAFSGATHVASVDATDGVARALLSVGPLAAVGTGCEACFRASLVVHAETCDSSFDALGLSSWLVQQHEGDGM